MKYGQEMVTVNGMPVWISFVDEISSMRVTDTVDKTEEIYLGETEFKAEGLYNLYYNHTQEKFYAVWGLDDK